MSYCDQTDTATASLDELAEYVTEQCGGDDWPSTARVRVQLHHSDLPLLADIGVIDYDARTNIARIRESPVVRWLREHRDDTSDR